MARAAELGAEVRVVRVAELAPEAAIASLDEWLFWARTFVGSRAC